MGVIVQRHGDVGQRRTICQNWDMVLCQLEIMFADRAVGCPLPLVYPGSRDLWLGRASAPSLPCFFSVILDFVEFRLHRFLRHALYREYRNLRADE